MGLNFWFNDTSICIGQGQMNRNEMKEKGRRSNKQYYNLVGWRGQLLKDCAPVIIPISPKIINILSLLVQSKQDTNLLQKGKMLTFNIPSHFNPLPYFSLLQQYSELFILAVSLSSHSAIKFLSPLFHWSYSSRSPMTYKFSNPMVNS